MLCLTNDDFQSYITHLSFDKTGTRVITSSIDGQIKLFDVRSFATTLKLLNGHQGVVSHAQFSANNRKVVSCGWDKMLCVWDIATGLFRHEGAKMFENGHEGSISSCLLDGNMMVSSSYDQTISVWDCVKGNVCLLSFLPRQFRRPSHRTPNFQKMLTNGEKKQ